MTYHKTLHLPRCQPDATDFFSRADPRAKANVYEDDFELFASADPDDDVEMVSTQTAPINIPSRSSTSPKQNDAKLKVEGPGNTGVSMANSDIQMAYTPVPGSIPIHATRMSDRRESLAGGSGSVMTGISWGPGSVSNWIGKDDIAMQGTSPYIGHDDLKSPNFFDSYMPRLEQSFRMEQEYMSGFKCCDIELASMHDLLRHFEERHANEAVFAENVMPTSPPVTSNAPKHPLSNANDPSAQRPGPMPSRAQQATPSIQSALNPLPMQPQTQKTSGLQMSTLPIQEDGTDELDEFSMDDIDIMPPLDQAANFGAPVMNGRSESYNFLHPLPGKGSNMSHVNPGVHNNFQKVQPVRPQAPQQLSTRGMYANNPTVSSVNTPSLVTNPLHHLQRDSPGSSMPGTPQELDADVMGAMQQIGFENAFPNNLQNHPFQAFNNAAYGNNENDTIDDPGKRLTSPGGPQSSSAKPNDTQDEVHQQLGSTQYGPDSDIAKMIRQRQLEAGMPESDQPYLCPVIGCMKAYKNSNGLRYHKQHGHKDQALKNNGDGTYSIVDSNGVPYPGTEGMARAKPYACKVCGRRYKNANGKSTIIVLYALFWRFSY